MMNEYNIIDLTSINYYLELNCVKMSKRNRMPATAPDKGSFPLDHFHECEEHAVRYNACLDKH